MKRDEPKKDNRSPWAERAAYKHEYGKDMKDFDRAVAIAIVLTPVLGIGGAALLFSLIVWASEVIWL